MRYRHLVGPTRLKRHAGRVARPRQAAARTASSRSSFLILSSTPSTSSLSTMARLTSLLLVLAAAVASTTTTDAQNVRSLAAMPAFQWVEDPHAADPCTEPGCVNHIKYGYNVVPISVTTDKSIVFQEATRPKGMGAVLYLDIYTQPGCVVSGCTTKKVLGLFPKEDCFNAFAEKIANQPDNATALLKFGGNYYENVPAGELYAKFEKKNYLTEKPTCTFEVRSGFKRWY